MTLAAAVHCFNHSRAAGNREAALQHLRAIHRELNWQWALRRFRQNKFDGCAPGERVASVFHFTHKPEEISK